MARRRVSFALAAFFALAACILAASGTALLLPGSSMDAIWTLYPARRAMLMPFRIWLGPVFLALAVVMLSACVGCFRQRKWGWWLAVAIFAANGLGDAAQLIFGRLIEGGIGVAVAAAILFYLTNPGVKTQFV